MNTEEIQQFEISESQIISLHAEMTLLSKKSPNDGVNKFKINLINKLLSTANQLLGESYQPLADFDKFDVDELLTNSDVCFVLAQYLECFEALRSSNICLSLGAWYWLILGEKSQIRTRAPKKITRK